MKKNYSKILFVLAITLFSLNSFSQNSPLFWSESNSKDISKKDIKFRELEPQKSTMYSLDLEALKTYLIDTPNRFDTSNTQGKLMRFPLSNGSFETFTVKEAPVMHEELQNKYNDIRTYVGKSIDNPINIMRFSVTPQGLNAIAYNVDSGLEYIDPYTKDATTYIVYAKKDLPKSDQAWECDVNEEQGFLDEKSIQEINKSLLNANDGLLRKFDIAIACTVEYAAYHWTAAGLTQLDNVAAKKAAVLAAMVVSLNRVNFIYERELSVTMNLVPNNENIIFIDSDFFNNESTSAIIDQSQLVIDQQIGFNNYDIGHTFATGGGGLAQVSSVCTSGKARAVSGLSVPLGDSFDIDILCHEIGHQFGARHTFNGSTGSCTTNITPTSAYEPGSGSTIMAYSGICAPQNVQNNADSYFHQNSLLLMWNNITNGNSTCAVTSPTGNNAPTAEAGDNYPIPALTPYKLTGSSTDPDGTDSHTYTWEQYDLGPAGLPSENNISGPLVRSFEGTTNPTRYIPRLQDLYNSGGSSTTWEKLASVDRPINFKLTVRDNDANGGQIAVDQMTAIVNSSAGPFVVTSQNNAQTVWTPGQTETITWNVAGTTANGINTANVNILLSTDGGDTFDTVLASNVPNDGSHDIVVPDVTAAYCRIMVEAVGNIFFNVNDEFFAIGNYNYETVEVCNDYVLNGGITIPENATSYASFTFSIPDNVQITDLNIAVDITHNNNGSLFHAYRYPGFLGSGVDPLLSGQCEGSSVTSFVFDDDGAIFDCFSVSNGDVVQAQSLLANANGTSSGGDWTFYIVDTDVGDGVTGTWNSTTFTICSSEIQPVLSKTEIDPNALAIYPNPNNGEFTINFDAITDNVNINVYDIRGRLVFDNSYKAQGQFNQNINLGNVQAGLYILNVQDGNQTLTKKLIVK